MVLLHFGGPEGPFGDPRALQVTYFSDSRNQLDFWTVFSLKMTPFLEPKCSKCDHDLWEEGVLGPTLTTFGPRGLPRTILSSFWISF